MKLIMITVTEKVIKCDKLNCMIALYKKNKKKRDIIVDTCQRLYVSTNINCCCVSNTTVAHVKHKKPKKKTHFNLA